LAADVRARLESAAREALRRSDLLSRIKDDGAIASGLSGEAFATFMAVERKRWGAVIRDANITLNE
jgi:tripartite-type tricarboxylate transporter receptor subunit TctC